MHRFLLTHPLETLTHVLIRQSHHTLQAISIVGMKQWSQQRYTKYTVAKKLVSKYLTTKLLSLQPLEFT